jgi:CRISPR-associated endonuclease Cas2
MINVIISYDISNNRLRKQVSDLLLREGCVRVQKSVFWAADFESKEHKALREQLISLLQKSKERVPSDSIIALKVEHDHSADALWWDEAGEVEKRLQKYLVKMF